MKKTILTILGGCLFGVASVSFACEGCHGPGKQLNLPDADNFQSNLSIPHPVSTPALQIYTEQARQAQLDARQKLELR